MSGFLAVLFIWIFLFFYEKQSLYVLNAVFEQSFLCIIDYEMKLQKHQCWRSYSIISQSVESKILTAYM